MSDLESKITELERELALKKGFQAVKFVLPKGTPDDVATEIQSKLREIADGLALSKEQLSSGDIPTTVTFTAEETQALRMVAETVLKRQSGSNTSTTPNAKSVPTTGVETAGSSTAESKSNVNPRKARIITTENVRGEGRKFAASEDDVYVPNPEKIDSNGMVSATHMRRGVMLKIPLDDLQFLD